MIPLPPTPVIVPDVLPVFQARVELPPNLEEARDLRRLAEAQHQYDTAGEAVDRLADELEGAKLRRERSAKRLADLQAEFRAKAAEGRYARQ
jgi:hypothetical protein